ncbi:MAG: sulfur carrier protein ThiS [Pelagibacterales bacterium]|nr:sulfur carrier protein ThiS [Pelagibacterales bacterium]
MSKVKIILNGEEKFVEKHTTIADLIQELELDIKKVAIEKDLEIISPDFFSKIVLNEGNKVEIVHFIGGG